MTDGSGQAVAGRTARDRPAFEALVFDCDGTLARNEAALFGSLEAALAQQSIALDADWFAARLGASTRELVEELGREHARLDRALELAQRERRYLELADGVLENPAVAAIAREHAGRVPLAVASGGPRRLVERTLAAIGLRELFDVVVTGDDVARPKPAPDAFLLAARRLGVAPDRCVAYEDSDAGRRAARAAGMVVVDVTAGALLRPHDAVRAHGEGEGDGLR